MTEQHKEDVRLFANVASCHPALQIINLDGNLIGADGQRMFTLGKESQIGTLQWSLDS